MLHVFTAFFVSPHDEHGARRDFGSMRIKVFIFCSPQNEHNAASPPPSTFTVIGALHDARRRTRMER